MTYLAKHYALFLVVLHPEPFFSAVEETNVFAGYHTFCFWSEFHLQQLAYQTPLTLISEGGGDSLFWPIWGGSARKGYLLQALGI